MAYTQRLNYFTKSRTWEVGADQLQWGEEGRVGVILFTDIRSVRMAFSPTRTERNRYSLKLETSRGSFEITNIDWQGPLSSEDNMDEFKAFSEEIHGAFARSNCDAQFHLGVSNGAYVGYWVLSLFVLTVLFAAGIFFLSVGLFWITGIKVLIILFYLPTLFRFLKKNYPRRYDPDTVPWDEISL